MRLMLLPIPGIEQVIPSLVKEKKGMGLAREKNVRLSYTGKESKSRQTKAIERESLLCYLSRSHSN